MIVDGHNVLYALRGVFVEHWVDGRPRSEAREALATRLSAAFDRPGAAVRLYFDGSEASTERRSDTLEVIYSGGVGEGRADQAILDDIKRESRAGILDPLGLVTSDLKLARLAERRGVTIIAPEDVLPWLSAAAATEEGIPP
nr:NYN domain-containing protein [Wenzhouxiangella sp. XN24]